MSSPYSSGGADVDRAVSGAHADYRRESLPHDEPDGLADAPPPVVDRQRRDVNRRPRGRPSIACQSSRSHRHGARCGSSIETTGGSAAARRGGQRLPSRRCPVNARRTSPQRYVSETCYAAGRCVVASTRATLGIASFFARGRPGLAHARRARPDRGPLDPARRRLAQRHLRQRRAGARPVRLRPATRSGSAAARSCWSAAARRRPGVTERQPPPPTSTVRERDVLLAVLRPLIAAGAVPPARLHRGDRPEPVGDRRRGEAPPRAPLPQVRGRRPRHGSTGPARRGGAAARRDHRWRRRSAPPDHAVLITRRARPSPGCGTRRRWRCR